MHWLSYEPRQNKCAKRERRLIRWRSLIVQLCTKFSSRAFNDLSHVFNGVGCPVVTIWAAFSLGTIYLFTQSIEEVYGQLYGWNAVQARYVQSAIAIGEIPGTCISLSSNHWYYASAARNTEAPGIPIPEARRYPAIIGGFFGVTGGMLVYRWAADPNIHWMAITVGLTMVSFGTTAVVISIANYLIDAYTKYAASGLAAVGFVENTFIAFLPLAASAMYTKLEFHWASTLLGCVSLILVVTPLVVIRWGQEIRARSPFMKEAIIVRKQVCAL